MNQIFKKEDNMFQIYPAWINVSDSGKITVNEVEFCSMLLREREIKCIDGCLRDLNGVINENELKHEICTIITQHIEEGISNKVKSLLDAIKLWCYSTPPEAHEGEIHLLNGLLKTNGEFIPNMQFCINRLNVEYNPQAKQPEKFLHYLSELLDYDDVKTLQEYLGYLLIPSTRGQAMLSIIGNGGEGKSVLGTVLKDIFTESMVEGSFHRIEADKFFRANLKDKLVFLDDELKIEKLPSTGYVKSLITLQTPTDIEFKFKQSYCQKLYARFLCFGNGAIRSLHDYSHAFNRRMIILSVKPVPKNRVINPNIADEIILEKSSILNWIYAGLRRLIENNYKFSVSEKSRLNAAEMMSDNCNISDYFNGENIEFCETAEISSVVLYNSYTEWCRDNAITAEKRDVFIMWTKNNQNKYNLTYSTHVKNDKGGNIRGFRGCRLYTKKAS